MPIVYTLRRGGSIAGRLSSNRLSILEIAAVEFVPAITVQIVLGRLVSSAAAVVTKLSRVEMFFRHLKHRDLVGVL
jgi:hypothetical protein